MKSTKEIADQLVSLCRQGKFDQAVEELYSPDIVSIEPEGAPFSQRTKGLEEMQAKGEKWQSMVEEMYGVEVSDPLVTDNHFSVSMAMDIKMKGGPRSKDAEICVYEVKDGKIVTEQFFYPTAG